MMDDFDIIFHRKLAKAVVEQMEPLQTQILEGKIADFAEYKLVAGRLSGLREALGIANAVQKSILGQDKVKES